MESPGRADWDWEDRLAAIWTRQKLIAVVVDDGPVEAEGGLHRWGFGVRPGEAAEVCDGLGEVCDGLRAFFNLALWLQAGS